MNKYEYRFISAIVGLVGALLQLFVLYKIFPAFMNQHFILDSLVIYWGALGIATLFNQIMRKKYPAKVEPFFVDETDERTISIR